VLEPCVTRYLKAVLSRSPARVVVMTGSPAEKAFRLVFDVAGRDHAHVEEGTAAGRRRLLLYLRHPEWLRRRPPDARAANELPAAVSPEQLEQLHGALRDST
jgi:hypothetical protein